MRLGVVEGVPRIVGTVVVVGRSDCRHRISVVPWDTERLGERVTGLDGELATHRHLWKCHLCGEERVVEYQTPLDH